MKEPILPQPPQECLILRIQVKIGDAEFRASRRTGCTRQIEAVLFLGVAESFVERRGFFAVLDFFFPWLLGLAAGVSFSLVLIWIIYRAMGGK